MSSLAEATFELTNRSAAIEIIEGYAFNLVISKIQSKRAESAVGRHKTLRRFLDIDAVVSGLGA